MLNRAYLCELRDASRKERDSTKTRVLGVIIGEIDRARPGVSVDVKKIIQKLVISNQENIERTKDEYLISSLRSENVILSHLLPRRLEKAELDKLVSEVTEELKSIGVQRGPAIAKVLGELDNLGNVEDFVYDKEYVVKYLQENY